MKSMRKIDVPFASERLTFPGIGNVIPNRNKLKFVMNFGEQCKRFNVVKSALGAPNTIYRFARRQYIVFFCFFKQKWYYQTGIVYMFVSTFILFQRPTPNDVIFRIIFLKFYFTS